jgi:uncharacterized protein DUF3775
MAPREKTPVLTDEERDLLAARAGVDTGETPTLAISPEKVCFIVVKAREFDVKDAPSLSDDASDGPDDDMRSVLEDRPDDPVRQELVAFIGALSFDEQVDLVTLMWMGRGDGTIADWYELRDTACNEHNNRTADYLLGTPLLADFLGEGLAQFGHSCEEFE